MKVAGEAIVHAPAEAVWAALHDRAVLARAIPGCERLEVTGPGVSQFIATTTMNAVSGTYSGQLAVAGRHRPDSLSVTASASGQQGTVTADLVLRLAADASGATLVSYEANGVAHGPVAGVGTRLLASAARRLAAEFFGVIDETVRGEPASGSVGEADSPETGAPEAGAPEAGAPEAGAAEDEARADAAPEAGAAEDEARADAAPEAGAPEDEARADAAAGADRLTRPDRRVAVLAGAATAVAAVVIGVLAARRGAGAGLSRPRA